METEEGRRARLENDAATKRLRLAHGEGRRKKSNSGEDIVATTQLRLAVETEEER